MALPAGIDLGTTKSVVCVWRGGRPEIVPSAEGERWTPSIVAFRDDGRPLVGSAARRQAIMNPDRTFWSFKHLFGVVDESAVVRGRHHSPGELATYVLRKLVGDAVAHTGEALGPVVLTVPAMFGVTERAVLAGAARAAGLQVERIIEEPLAASLAYGLTGDEDSRQVLTFDLGGGTLDVAILDIGDGIYEVMAFAGDTRLGGDDWDRRIVDRLAAELRRDHDVDLTADPVALQRLYEAAEQAKVDLSVAMATSVLLPHVARTSAGPLTLTRRLTRSELEGWTDDLVERCRMVIDQALEEASRPPDGTHREVAIDHVLLVGGASRIPAVIDLVRRHTGREPHYGINPDEVVAVGAALQAGILSGDVKDKLPLNVLPLSLGVELRGGAMFPILARNTNIPTRRSDAVTTGDDWASPLVVYVLQGEREMAVFDEPIAMLEVPVAPAPAGVPRIELTCDIDANGIIVVSGRDEALGQVVHTTVTDQTARVARRHRAARTGAARDVGLPSAVASVSAPDGQERATAGSTRRSRRPDAASASSGRPDAPSTSRPPPAGRDDAPRAMPHVFVSYSQEDATYVEKLAAHVGMAGVGVWWDREIEPSDDWVVRLEERIRTSVAVIAVMSPHAERSTWVRRELLFAEDIGKPILPLRLAGRRMLQLFNLQDEDVRTGLMPSDRFMARLLALSEAFRRACR